MLIRWIGLVEVKRSESVFDNLNDFIHMSVSLFVCFSTCMSVCLSIFIIIHMNALILKHIKVYHI